MMEELTLVRARGSDNPFAQYVPGNFRPLLDWEDTLCVGAVYKGAACAAALAEPAEDGYYLRYIYVDPAVRLCGLGTHLLRGLLGLAGEAGAAWVKAMWSPSMLENGGQTLGILERAGFSPPEPVSTFFHTRLGDIPASGEEPPEGMAVYNADELPDELADEYIDLVESGALPPFADASGLRDPSAEISAFCTVDGALAGVLLIDLREEGLHLAGVYVLEEYRHKGVLQVLADKALAEARALYPPETAVWTSTINRDSFAACDRMLRRGSAATHETEFLSVFRF